MRPGKIIIRSYAVMMWLLAIGLCITTYIVSKTHHLNAIWIVYVLAAVAIYGGAVAWRASNMKPVKRPIFDNILKASNQAMYHITEQPIQPGDLIYNIYTMDIDKCYKINNNGTISVQKLGTPYLKVVVINAKNYRKAIRI